LFNSLAGFALEVGDRLLINGEEVIFKGWVDQSQTSIEVKAIADAAVIKQVRAKEIQSLARSQDSTATQPSAPNSTQNKPEKSSDPSSSKETGSTEASDWRDDHKFSDHAEVLPEPETIETPKEPEYNAWEVWTYLERQRVNTLKLLNTFQTEWEANRFVREAERSAPSNLRVHYEVRPIWLDETEIKRSYQNTEPSHKSHDRQSDRAAKDYDDAIDVEIVTESR